MKKYTIEVNIGEREIFITDREFNEIDVAQEHTENRYGSLVGVLSWSSYPLDPEEDYNPEEDCDEINEADGRIRIDTNHPLFPKGCGVDMQNFDACLHAIKDYIKNC